MKRCVICKTEKRLIEFYKCKLAKEGLFGSCSSCRKISKQKSLKRQMDFYYKNRDSILAKQKIRDAKRTRKILNEDEKLAISQRTSKNNKIRKKKDKVFKLICNLRNRIYFVFKGKAKSKNSTVMLGTSPENAKKYIESKFYVSRNGMSMTWDNHGAGQDKWQIDHIAPLGLAHTEEELEKLCHFTNLQPLWYEDHCLKTSEDIKKINLSKINKLSNKNIS